MAAAGAVYGQRAGPSRHPDAYNLVALSAERLRPVELDTAGSAHFVDPRRRHDRRLLDGVAAAPLDRGRGIE